MLTIQSTVGQWVADRPARARAFESMGIDYCCGGKKPLAEACAAKGLDAPTVAIMLDAITSEHDADVDANAMTMTQLANHIEQTHHQYLRTELPRLRTMTAKVAAVHGDTDARLLGLAEVFAAFADELDHHMMKEEQILFPICRQLETANQAQAFHCGSVTNPIHVMELEHDAAGDALAQMRQLTDDFTPPAHACNTWRVTLDSLAALEQDMHRHVHKENNVLFPRAATREQELLAVSASA